jgi:hypothetical protein
MFGSRDYVLGRAATIRAEALDIVCAIGEKPSAEKAWRGPRCGPVHDAQSPVR